MAYRRSNDHHLSEPLAATDPLPLPPLYHCHTAFALQDYGTMPESSDHTLGVVIAVVFEPAVSTGEWLHTDALDRAATGTGSSSVLDTKIQFVAHTEHISCS